VQKVFVTDPNCWAPWFGNKEMRQGVTYTGTPPPAGYFFHFNVYYWVRLTALFGCTGNPYAYTRGVYYQIF